MMRFLLLLFLAPLWVPLLIMAVVLVVGAVNLLVFNCPAWGMILLGLVAMGWCIRRYPWKRFWIPTLVFIPSIALILTGILGSIISNRSSEIAEAQIQQWWKNHPFVEPTPTPEVRRATRVYRGTNGQWVMLPPTNPDGSFNLNSGM